jgi:hypothetical protein
MGWLFNWRTLGVIFLAYFLITRPASAAGLVHKGLGVASNAGDSLGTFVSHL